MKPYEFNRVSWLTFDLVNAYHTVNDSSTLDAVYATVVTEILALDGGLDDFCEALKDRRLTSDKGEKLLDGLLERVKPFELPDVKLDKLFKKVKKLKLPDLIGVDLRRVSYLGWNDPASSRKYLLTADGRGFYGTISGQAKNICAICQKTSVVTQFMATTKSAGDGTYTKNGNWICLDSNQCNRQIQRPDGLDKFFDWISEKK